MWPVSYKRPTDDMTYQAGGKRLKTGGERDKRKRFIDEMYDRLTLDAEDKKKSRAYVDKILGEIIGHVRRQEDGKIYGHQIVKAGSYPINAKIGKADEFDTNILLNLEPKCVHRCGQVHYMFREVSNQGARQQNMYTDLKLVRTDVGSRILEGYAVVDVKEVEAPSKFVHTNEPSPTLSQLQIYPEMRSNYYPVPFAWGPSSAIQRRTEHTEVINKSTQSGCIHIIPRDVKQDLHQKIKRARNELGLDDVSISNTSQGPALTLTISPKTQDIRHNISVDITASLKCASKLKFEDFGWPRQQTRKAFKKENIEAAIETGIHLVPKKDLFWSISFSRAERALLSSIDREFGCRKRVLKLLKKFVEKCKSGSASKLPGISSHILKTQILWSCEMHADDNIDYWNYDNRDECLTNTMIELENSLRRRKIPEYFNDSLNVLGGKEPGVLDELADYLNREMRKIKQII